MNTVGQIERTTQDRIVKLFPSEDRLVYGYFGDTGNDIEL